MACSVTANVAGLGARGVLGVQKKQSKAAKLSTVLPLRSARAVGIPSSFLTSETAIPKVSPALAPRTQRQYGARAAASGAYICNDCGYIYNARPKFETLPDDYRCPVCKAPKRRFRPYTAPVAKNANDLAVRKARKEQLKAANSALGSALPALVIGIVVVLVGTFVYLNATLN